LGENAFKVEGIGSTIKVDLNGDGNVNADQGVNIYTKTGAVLNVTAPTNDTVEITETPIYSLSGEPTGTNITVTASYSSNDVSFSLDGITTNQFGSENRYGGVTDYGTYVEHDTDADTIKIYYPGNRPAYALVAVGPNPVWSTTEATPGTSAITYKKSVPVTVPLAVLDSEVTSAHRAEKHLILVGGPCVNSLVAELATAGKLTYEGSPLTCDAWNARTDAGDVFGLLRLVENAFATGKVALVVAGSRAEQTRWATSILQNFDQYNLTGTAVKITSPNTIETI
jgi:S-layer protein (TIGR01564 family)